MDINDMSEQEKSVKLARLCGWKIMEDTTRGTAWVKCPDFPHATTNLYMPEFMALAWYVLNWVMNYPMDSNDAYQFMAQFRFGINPEYIMSQPPAAAQRTWLDSILQLAIEAGLVT